MGANGELEHPHQDGMSLRDYFACHLGAAFLSSLTEQEWPAYGKPTEASKTAYQYADAMLAARSSPEPHPMSNAL